MPWPAPASGKQMDAATASTGPRSGNAPRTVGSGDSARKSPTLRRRASAWAGSRSTIALSSRAHRPGRPPASSTSRPQAASCSRSALQTRGSGVASLGFDDRAASNAAAPAARGRASAGNSRSSATSSSGAAKGLKPSPPRARSPAPGHGSEASIHASFASPGPSKACAKHRRCASPALRKACARRRRRHSSTSALPSEARRPVLQPFASKPPAKIA
mmetsp:Transcript_24127/g.72477  ORF Transcript_24127/g.72477 Transcript_24127/m.72477 type:complete len:217 (-) Transcript_24127:443-1093(-)